MTGKDKASAVVADSARQQTTRSSSIRLQLAPAGILWFDLAGVCRFQPTQTTMAVLNVPPALRQAFWRLALNGNPHWFWYTKKSKVTLGHIASTGKDFTQYAGLPYHFTTELVDELQLGFGFYSRSEIEHCRWAGFDLEPLHDGHPIKNPLPEQLAAAERESRSIYKAWVELARTERRILWVLRVCSSPGRYHVWVLFDQPVTQKEHDRLARKLKSLRTGT